MKKSFQVIYGIALWGMVLLVLIFKFLRIPLGAFFSFAMLPFTILAGIAAILNWKLPKHERAKVKYPAYSVLSMHPIITFLFFLVINILFLVRYIAF